MYVNKKLANTRIKKEIHEFLIFFNHNFNYITDLLKIHHYYIGELKK